MPTLKTRRVHRLQNEKFYLAGLLSILLLIWLFAYPTVCQANPNLNNLWQGIIQASTASPDSLQDAINQFTSNQQQNDIKNATLYSLALLKLTEHNNLTPVNKDILTTAAITISPDYSFPETAYSKLTFRQHRYLTSFASFFKAVKKFKNNPFESLYASTFFWLAAVFTPLTLLFFFTLFLSVKYYRAFCEMGYLNLSQKGGLATLLSSLIAALLIIIVPTPLFGLLLLTAAIALLATRRDIITITILTTTLLIVPFAYEKGMASLLALDSSFFKAARLSTSGINSPGNDVELRQPATNQSQLALQLFSQAESARQRQEFSQAEVFLEKIIANKIEIGAAYNNLANIYLLQGKAKKSEELFIKAANLEKSSGIPYYNLSRAYIQQSFDLKKSSQALEMAFKRDPSLSADDSTEDNLTAKLQNRNKLIFMSLPENFYRRYADAQPNKDIYLPEFLRQLIFPGTGRTLYFALVILTIIGLFYLERQAPANRRICSECGRLFHPIQKLKEKQCPVCYLKQQSQTGSQLKNMADSANHPAISLPNVCRTAAGVLLPGFYPLITGNIYIAAGLMMPAILWLYNFLICQTGIMAPFPPSTEWLINIAPFLIWTTNLIVLILLIVYRQRHNTLSGSNA